jgi:hypothetical protein
MDSMKMWNEPPKEVVRCQDPITGSTSDFVGDLVQVSKVLGGFIGTNCFSRIGTGANTFGSPILRSVGDLSDRDPEKAEFGSGGESNRGRPVYSHYINEYSLQGPTILNAYLHGLTPF